VFKEAPLLRVCSVVDLVNVRLRCWCVKMWCVCVRVCVSMQVLCVCKYAGTVCV